MEVVKGKKRLYEKGCMDPSFKGSLLWGRLGHASLVRAAWKCTKIKNEDTGYFSNSQAKEVRNF